MARDKTTKIGRREVLRRTALLTVGAAAPYVVPASALGRGKKAAANERVTLGFIAMGGIGRRLLRWFMNSEDAECVAICDAYADRREGAAALTGAKSYRDFRQVLARDDVDAVVISPPDHWHVPIANAAARAGKHVYVEKPLGLSIEQDLTCRQVIQDAGVVFQYGTRFRSQAHTCFGCELVRNGKIGELKALEVVAPNGAAGGSTQEAPVPDGLDYEMWLGPAPYKPYTVDRCVIPGVYWIHDYSIGYLAGWGAHALDLLVWGCDADLAGPMTFEGTGEIPAEGLYDTVYNWDVTVQMAGGVKMTFRPGRDSTKFIGSEGWVEVRSGGIDAEPKSLLDVKFTADDLRLVASDRAPSQTPHGGATVHQQNFLDAILGRQPAVAPLKDAVRSDIISHLSNIAVRTGRRITWDPDKEQILGDADAAELLHRPLREPWTL